MEKKGTRALLEAVQAGEMSVNDALAKLKMQPFEDLGFAKIDTQRELRQGVPEVIYGKSKTPEQIYGIVEMMLSQWRKDTLITRMSPTAAEKMQNLAPFVYDPLSEIGVVNPDPNRAAVGCIVIASGGTSDMNVCAKKQRSPPRCSVIRSCACTMWALQGCTACCRILM